MNLSLGRSAVASLATSTLAIGAFAAIGGLSGWMVGNSQSPVVAALLPLVFGLLGGIGVSFFEQRKRMAGLLDKLDAGDRAKLSSAPATDGSRSGAASVFFVCVLVLCGSCYVGLQNGIATRVGVYPPLQSLAGVPVLEPSDRAQLYNLYWELQAAGVPLDHVVDLFSAIGELRGEDLASVIATVRTGVVQPASAASVSSDGSDTTVGVSASRPSRIAAQQPRALYAVLLDVADESDPVLLDETTSFVVTLTHQGSSEETGIRVTFELADQFEFVSVSGPTAVTVGRVDALEPLARLAPGQTATWRIKARAIAVGEARSRFVVTTDQRAQPSELEEMTFVYE